MCSEHGEWPDEVILLDEDDFLRGTLGVGTEKHCLVGWRNVVFGGKGLSDDIYPERTDVLHKVYVALRDEMDLIGKKGRYCTNCVVGFNDDPSVPFSLLAKTWNRAMARLGYVVGNPEAG